MIVPFHAVNKVFYFILKEIVFFFANNTSHRTPVALYVLGVVQDRSGAYCMKLKKKTT